MQSYPPAWFIAALMLGLAAPAGAERGAYAGQFRVVAGLGDDPASSRGEFLLLSVERMVTPWIGLHGRLYTEGRDNRGGFVQSGMLLGAAYHFRPLRAVDWMVFGEVGLAAADAVSTEPDFAAELAGGIAAEVHLDPYHFVQLQYRLADTRLDDDGRAEPRHGRELWALGMGWLF